MTERHLQRRISVGRPRSEAELRLRNFYRAHGADDDRGAEFPIEIEVPIPGLPRHLTMRRSMLATLQPYRHSDAASPRYRVRWATEERGVSPHFAGELLVEGSADAERFELKLCGDHAPPIAQIGRNFDATLGRTIADAAATHFLARVRDWIESDRT